MAEWLAWWPLTAKRFGSEVVSLSPGWGRVETLDQCRKDCLVDPWSSWRSCSGPCGHQKQIRGRKLCCDEALKPWNWEHCLQHCNLPNTFENLQFKQCRVCKNGGKLLSISDPCICSSRYKGDCCEDEVKCSDNPCKHGTCSVHSSSFVCTCYPGYKGIDCDIRKTCSDGITCQNGGSCQDGSNGFQCQCSNRFLGEFCEKAITCSDSPCQNGGSCSNTGSSFQCKCLPTHTGNLCEKVILCSSQPCLHGTCTDTPSGFSCACDVKHTGAKCDQLIKCVNSPCVHGSCQDTITGFTCNCDPKFSGITCDTRKIIYS
eukprot:XP_019919973.1 PREDICTED: fibropellin-3-like [Crassostrea gigas]